MFVVLEIKGREKSGIFGGVFNILTKPKTTREIVEAFDRRYARIRAERGRRGVDLDAVFQMAGAYASRILCSEELAEELLEYGLKPPAMPRFESLVMMHTVCDIVQQTRIPLYRRVVGMLDPAGRYGQMLSQVLKFCTTVKVYTQNMRYYRQVAEDMMEEYGAPVQLCEQPESLADCILVVAPEGAEGCEGTRFAGPVLVGEHPPAGPVAYDWAARLRLVPPDSVLAQIPGGISPHRFAGAMLEYCGADLCGFVAGRVIFHSVQVDVGVLADFIRRKSGLADIR